MSRGLRKYASEAERAAAMKAYQKAYREARKAGTWVRKNAVRIAGEIGAELGLKANSARARRKLQRQVAKDSVTILKRADRIVRREEAKASRVAARETEREGIRRDNELADQELERRRVAAERREQARRARMTPEDVENERHIAEAELERQILIAREKYGFELCGKDATPSQAAGRRRYLDDIKIRAGVVDRKLAHKRELLVEKFRAKRLSAEAAQRAVEERIAEDRRTAIDEAQRQEIERAGHVPKKRKRHAELHQELLVKYGFAVWKKDPEDPNSEEELEARRRYVRDKDGAYRDRNREYITNYNREYRRRKRAEALAMAQKSWSAGQFEKWRRRQDAKILGKGSPAWMLGEVVKLLADKDGISRDDVMARMIEYGGVEFVLKGAGALGPKKAVKPSMIKAASRAVEMWLNSGNMSLFKIDI